jgi:hypothetical protein
MPSGVPAPLSGAEMLALFDDVHSAFQKCPTDIAIYDTFDDETVQALHRKMATISRLSGIRMAITADQIAQRSAAELAGKGMARQFGDRTAVEMTKNLGGLTQQEAMAALHAGRMMREEQSNTPESDLNSPETDSTAPTPPPVKRPTPPPGPAESWLAAVSRALKPDEISRAQAEAIRTGLGRPTEGITVAVLTDAATRLVADGRTMTPERLVKLARQTRDRLDRDGVALREAERHEMRSAKIFERADGMMQLTWVMDPELGMQIRTLCDRSTSPKMGGPRVGDAEAETVRRIKDDPRAPQHILSDNLRHFIEVGAAVDPSNILATPTASVVVLTTRRHKSNDVHHRTSNRAHLSDGSQDADRSQTAAGSQNTDRSQTADGSQSTDGLPTTDDGVRQDASQEVDGSPSRNNSSVQDGSPTWNGLSDQDGSSRPDEPSRRDGMPNPHDFGVDHFPTGQYDLGWINGHPDPLSPETVDRLVCGGGTNEVAFTQNLVPLDVGREQRLFTTKQRIALGAQFGGCGWIDENGNPVCERPPTWCEAHHVEHWYRDKGKTVMSNGILLCKSHHLQLHNDHWEIIRQGNTFWLIPPVAVDPSQTPRPMRATSNAYRDLEIGTSA